MELNRPLATVTPTLDGDVLALLANHAGALTTGEMHRMLKHGSQEGIRKVLARLTRQGVVHSERVGNTLWYRLNQEHLAADAIMQLARLQQMLIRRLEDRLAAWQVPALYAAIFGSAALGTMTVESDLDLFLLRSDDAPHNIWEGQVNALATEVTTWTGNDARPLEFTLSELLRAPDEAVLLAVLREGLTVAGSRSWLAARLREEGGEDADQ